MPEAAENSAKARFTIKTALSLTLAYILPWAGCRAHPPLSIALFPQHRMLYLLCVSMLVALLDWEQLQDKKF